jgi:hypothetical protein
MTTPDVQLWHSLLTLAALVTAVAAWAARALKARGTAASASAEEPAPTHRLAA